jgi:peptidoglycan/xylan/chitin deacetylase (PgdA/CDA1 family)
MKITGRNIMGFMYAKYLMWKGSVKKANKEGLSGNHILSIYFHNPNQDLYEKCVKWLKNNGYNFLSVDDLNLIRKGVNIFPKGGVVITVDDGWKENKENIVAVAESYKIPVTIFVTTSPVETGESYWWSYIQKAFDKKLTNHSVGALKLVSNEQRMQELERIKPNVPNDRDALTIEEVKTISQSPYITIGSHTVTHPILTMCNDEKSKYELVESQKTLENWTNKSVHFFAYPNGNYTQREINVLKSNGFQMAFTTKPEYVTLDSFKSPFEIPRFDVLEDVSFAENIIRMTGVWFEKKKQ